MWNKGKKGRERALPYYSLSSVQKNILLFREVYNFNTLMAL